MAFGSQVTAGGMSTHSVSPLYCLTTALVPAIAGGQATGNGGGGLQVGSGAPAFVGLGQSTG